MDKLTLKKKRQLAFLMVCVLLFSSVPVLDLLVYAQGSGTATVSGGGTTDGGTDSGSDTPGTGSGADVEIIPTLVEFEYFGWSKVEDENGNIVRDISNNGITDTMCVYAKDIVSCKIHIENVQDIQKVKVFDEFDKDEITDNIDRDDLGNNEWCITVPISIEGEHIIKLKYCKTDSGLEQFAKSATIIMDKTRATLVPSPSKWESAWLEDAGKGDKEILQESDGEPNTLYYKGSMHLDFAITEEHFKEDDVEFKVEPELNPKPELTWELDGKSENVWKASYSISNTGEYGVNLNYQDRSGNEPPIEFSRRIILDDTAPELSNVKITPWKQAVESDTLETLPNYVFGKRQDVNLYYIDQVNMTFTIVEKNFHGADVVFEDNGEKVSPQSGWEQGKDDDSDSWTATYNISGEGKHIVNLKYQDRSGNAPIEYISETIIIDSQEPQISIGDAKHQPVKTAEGTEALYYDGKQDVAICIKEDNFRASDVKATVSVRDAVAEVDVNSITTELKNSSSWTKTSDGYVAYIDLSIDGKYEVTIEYVDLAMNNAKKSALIIVDTIFPKVSSVSYDKILCRRMVGKDNQTATEEEDIARYLYQCPMTFELTIEEEHFTPGFAEVAVYRNGKKLEEGDGYHYKYGEKWHTKDEKFLYHTLSLTIGERDGVVVEGDYQVIVNCKDLASNPMESYTSKIITIDKTSPEIAVTYNDIDDAKNGTYYKKTRVATITVTDENVVSSGITVNVTAKDIGGNALPYNLDAKQIPWSFDKQNKTWKSKITYDMDANYVFIIRCEDLAGNGNSGSDIFTVDGTAPDTESFKIEYSTPILETPDGNLQNSFYKDSVTVKITAKDKISPIDSFEWTYKKQPGASSVNQESETQVINNKDVKFTYDATKATATAEFTLTADQVKQYRGNLCLKATDMAGNTSEELTDNGRIVIVDNISPSRTVEYSPANHIVNKYTLETLKGFDYASENVEAVLFYNAAMKITFKVNEANFYANDVVVKVNGTAKSITDWSKDGDVWTGSLSIAGDGEYVVTLQYKDRSTNKMVDYVSHTIIVDTIKPKIQVSYAPKDAKQVIDGTKYYDKEQTATITIEERNFRAGDVKAVVKATDINGNSIDVQNFAAYLKNRNNWVTQGDKHTAKINFVKDANYEFDIDFKDLALTSADDYQKDVFTVDQTAPTNVKVSYSSPVSERSILGTEYAFYKDPIVVTVSAEDEVSGVYSFDYSYIRAAGVSSVNSEGINKRIEGQDIKYSDGKKTATATFVIPASELRSGTQLNGNMEFVANNRSLLKKEYKDSKRYVVDNIAPKVTIAVNGSEQQTNGSSYYAENVYITITVDEANFYQEDVKVSISKDGGEQYAAGVSWRTISVDRHVGSITLDAEGNYRVYVSYQDASTNKVEDYQSNLLIIDKTQPSISVSGIKFNSANKQEQIGFVVTVEDANLNTGSFKPVLQAEIKDESGNIRQMDCTELGTIKTVTVGKSCTYTISNISRDGIYQLTCLASDMSGNTTEDMIVEDSNKQTLTQLNYSVNRNGSTYSLGEATRKLVNNFVKKAIDVVVYETNPDEISNIKITLFKNDETIILEDGKDYVVNRVSDDGDWYKYQYTIYDTNFVDDGTYRISIYSEDKAGNIAENNLDVKNVEISFGIDKTLPNLIVTNLESKTTYPVDKLSVLMRATDNMKLQSITVELDGRVIASWNEEQIQQMNNDLQDFVFEILGDETKAHAVTITLTDIAGNHKIETISDFYVTRNLWVRFINNKILLYGSIIACLTIGLVLVLLGKRRKAHQ